MAVSVKSTENCLDYDSEIPYIFGGLLDGEYVFEGLHFHWGGRNNRGSEHILDDIRYPMEMHLVHRNRKYNDVNEALKHKDGLSVLGVFFQVINFFIYYLWNEKEFMFIIFSWQIRRISILILCYNIFQR